MGNCPSPCLGKSKVTAADPPRLPWVPATIATLQSSSNVPLLWPRAADMQYTPHKSIPRCLRRQTGIVIWHPFGNVGQSTRQTTKKQLFERSSLFTGNWRKGCPLVVADWGLKKSRTPRPRQDVQPCVGTQVLLLTASQGQGSLGQVPCKDARQHRAGGTQPGLRRLGGQLGEAAMKLRTEKRAQSTREDRAAHVLERGPHFSKNSRNKEKIGITK
nr:uncharacterized protein LOC108393529 [Manis javanica]